MRRAVLPGIAMLAAALGAAQLLGADPRKDPVAEAFVLPRGAVLRPHQAKAYQQLREQFQPLLRSALARVESTTDEKEKLEAVAEVKRIRGQIRLAILDVLRIPPPKKAKAGAQGKKKPQAKKSQQRKKKKAQPKKKHRKKKGGHRKRGGGGKRKPHPHKKRAPKRK